MEVYSCRCCRGRPREPCVAGSLFAFVCMCLVGHAVLCFARLVVLGGVRASLALGLVQPALMLEVFIGGLVAGPCKAPGGISAAERLWSCLCDVNVGRWLCLGFAVVRRPHSRQSAGIVLLWRVSLRSCSGSLRAVPLRGRNMCVMCVSLALPAAVDYALAVLLRAARLGLGFG